MKRAITVVAACALVLSAAGCKRDDAPRLLPTTTTSTLPEATTSTTVAPRTFDGTRSTDPAAAAAASTAAEAASVDPVTPETELRNAAVALQLGYRFIGSQPYAFEDAIRAALPDEPTRQALAFNVHAARHLAALSGSSPPKDAPPPEWRIVAPAPADELVGYYQSAAATTGVPWEILASVHLVETRLGRIDGDVLGRGAWARCSFLPSTWAAYGEGDIHSNRDAIAAAARYLQANGAPERLDDALFRYNHSSHYVEAIQAYARRMGDDPRAFRRLSPVAGALPHSQGTLMLPEGWPAGFPRWSCGLALRDART